MAKFTFMEAFSKAHQRIMRHGILMNDPGPDTNLSSLFINNHILAARTDEKGKSVIGWYADNNFMPIASLNGSGNIVVEEGQDPCNVGRLVRVAGRKMGGPEAGLY